MALTFPSTPTNGQYYTDATTGNRYVYNATAGVWTFAANNVGMSISSTPPANVASGALWYNREIGRTFVYYDDGDSKQWVETVPATGFFDSSTVAGYANAATQIYLSPVYNTANAAYDKANAALPNVSNAVFQGNLRVTGVLSIGSNTITITDKHIVANDYYRMNTSGHMVAVADGNKVNTIYSIANSAYDSANNVGPQLAPAYNTANAAFGVANTALANTSGVTFAGDLTVTGNTTIKKKTVINYTPATADNAAVYIATANAQGGTGYADFLRVQNISHPGVTNPNKTFRLNSTGGIEVINSAYTANLLTITDGGLVNMPYQPVFAAVGGSTQSWSGTSALQTLQLSAQTISINSRGSGYNTSTYRFTAPVSGMYMFFGKITQTTSATGPSLSLYVNGSGVAYEMTINYGGGGYVAYSSASGMIPYYMNSGDYAELKVINYNNTTVTIDLTRSNFVGWLLG